MFAIRKGPWKLCLTPGSGGMSEKERGVEAGPRVPEGQLYNLDHDSKEENNLYEKHPEIVKHLTELLEKYKDQGHSK